MNNPTPGLSIECPNCRQPFSAIVESIIDGGRNPAAKARLLSRRLNVVQCPHCGTASQISVPLVYHDHEKELLVIYVPMEMNLPPDQRERYVGEMTRVVMNSLPQEERKAYLFNPTNALTLDGLIKQVLEKDGITEEMIAEQQEKMQLVEEFLKMETEELAARVDAQDDLLDSDFFELMTVAAEGAANTGDVEAAEAIMTRRDELLSMSSYGQELLERARKQEAILREVAERLQAMGPQLELADFIAYLLEIGDSDEHLQALVSLVRPSLDYNFFMGLQQAASDRDDPDEAKLLEHVHERLVAYTQQIDSQQQAAAQQAAMVIQQLLQAPDLDATIQEMLPMVDDFFLSVLAANVQAAEQRNDLMGASRLRNLYEKIMEALQRNAPPEVQFINELLRQDDPLEARLMLTERAPEFGEPLVEYMNLLLQRMNTPETEHLADLLTELRDAAESILADGGAVR